MEITIFRGYVSFRQCNWQVCKHRFLAASHYTTVFVLLTWNPLHDPDVLIGLWTCFLDLSGVILPQRTNCQVLSLFGLKLE